MGVALLHLPDVQHVDEEVHPSERVVRACYRRTPSSLDRRFESKAVCPGPDPALGKNTRRNQIPAPPQ
jgi:hypothetical protein